MLKLTLVLITVALLRLIPYLVTGVPYHTDTYALLPLMELLKLKTPTQLTINEGFDDYNVYWPGVIIYAVYHSIITGLSIPELTSITVPLVNALSILPLVVFLRALSMCRDYSLIAILLYGLAGTEVVLGAGVTKEGYAMTLMTLSLALMVLILKGYVRLAYLALVTHLALIITHHLTSVAVLVLTTYLIIAYLGSRISYRLLAIALLLHLTNALALATYIGTYSVRALPTLRTLGISDAISITAYEVAATLPVILSILLRREFKGLIRLWFIGIYILVVTLALLSARVEVVLGAPKVSLVELILFTPYLLIALVGILGVGSVVESPLSTFTYLLILGTLGIEGFLIFGTPGLISEAYRFSTFTYLGVSILTACSISVGGKYLRCFKLVVVIASLIVSVYVIPYTAFYSGYVGGSQRVYLPSDIFIANYVTLYGDDIRLCGDLRFKYLIYPREVDVYGGLNYLLRRSTPKCYLVLNELMDEIGYVALEYGVPVDVGSLRIEPMVYVGGRNYVVIPSYTL